MHQIIRFLYFRCTPANSLAEESRDNIEQSRTIGQHMPLHISIGRLKPSLTSDENSPNSTDLSRRSTDAVSSENSPLSAENNRISTDSSISCDIDQPARPTTCPITYSETASSYKVYFYNCMQVKPLRNNFNS